MKKNLLLILPQTPPRVNEITLSNLDWPFGQFIWGHADKSRFRLPTLFPHPLKYKKRMTKPPV